jgi:dTDP-4-amino-4,6-dideoxygalactose transaminase
VLTSPPAVGHVINFAGLSVDRWGLAFKATRGLPLGVALLAPEIRGVSRSFRKASAMTIHIPFNKPCIVGSELIYVGQAVAGGHASGDGPFTRRAQKLLEERFCVHRVLLTTSCTAALEMAALLCNLGPGDEVILPSYTFVSTANAVVLRGATPVFVDIRPDTLNIDERLIEAAVTPRTRAIFPVHYAGVACEMDEIMALARRYNLLVVEDAAQGVFAKYEGRWLGAIGHLGCYSFHETKNFSCGEGGALVVNDRSLEKRAEILRWLRS